MLYGTHAGIVALHGSVANSMYYVLQSRVVWYTEALCGTSGWLGSIVLQYCVALWLDAWYVNHWFVVHWSVVQWNVVQCSLV